MPTGYTSDIYDGKDISLKEFTLTCAKAFGAFMHMKEYTLNEKIVMPEPSNYHINRINELKKELLELDSVVINIEHDYFIALQEYNKKIKKNTELIKKYDDMISKVKNWIPPTETHQSLKKFMLQQLVDSKDFDTYNLSMPKKDERDESAIKEEMRLDILKQIDYHEKKHSEEVKRVENNIKWINDLLDSL